MTSGAPARRRLGWRAPRGRQGRDGSARLTDRGRALVAAGITLAVSGVALGFVDLTRVGILVLALPLLTSATARFSRPRLEVKRTARPPAVPPGRRAEVTVSVSDAGGRRLPELAVEESLPAAVGGPARTVLLPGPSRRGDVTTAGFRYAIEPRTRGRHVLGPLVTRTRDPFGLTIGRSSTSGTGEIVVLPAIHPLAEDPPGRDDGGADGDAGGGLAGSTVADPATIRGYRSGDDLRRIHWPATAHRGELMVRHDAAGGARRAVLVLDPAVPVDTIGADGQAPLLEWAVEFVASVATRLDASGWELRLLPTDPVARAETGRSLDLDIILRDLAVLGPVAPSTLAAASGQVASAFVTAAREAADDGGLLVLVTYDRSPVARELLRSRPRQDRGLAVVLGAPGSPEAAACAVDADAGGWRAVVATPATPVPEAWRALVTGDDACALGAATRAGARP